MSAVPRILAVVVAMPLALVGTLLIILGDLVGAVGRLLCAAGYRFRNVARRLFSAGEWP